MTQSLGIVLMGVVAAVGYGIAHDQVTARVCVEYFTVGHPPVFGTDDPTLLGLGWGILATWWVGLLLGVPLAVVARAGSRPKRSVRSLVRPVGRLLLVTAACALVAGLTGRFLASWGAVYLVGPIARDLPADRHVPFLADLWAHTASYLVGLAGGIVVLVSVWRSRGRAASAPAQQGP
jgi:drug/metabolite transporter superfamily protein YnfA